MSLASVRQTLVRRLDADDRGDRGWWILTRVHVAPDWLKGMAEYLEHLTNGSVFAPTQLDYSRLGTIIESRATNPGQQLRRHHLLVMDKPLQLLERLNGNRWDELVLTDRGRQLAYADDIGRVLEDSLAEIRFAKAPWSPAGRVKEYASFDVWVYSVTKEILNVTGGYIDRDEFDFFVSRIRNAGEVDWAVKAIAAYRELTPSERNSLHDEVRQRIPGEKAYSNWRDMGLHTFSLFSLGTRMVRSGTRLLLTGWWVRTANRTGTPAAGRARSAPRTMGKLRMPNPPEADELLAPPAAPASNDGTDAESFVAKVLSSQGWRVAFYTNRRGYGFDLWARKGERAMLIEVKSSVGQHDAVILTQAEYLAARKHGKNFILAIVEDMGKKDPRLTLVQNPAKATTVSKQASVAYRIARSDWLKAAGR